MSRSAHELKINESLLISQALFDIFSPATGFYLTTIDMPEDGPLVRELIENNIMHLTSLSIRRAELSLVAVLRRCGNLTSLTLKALSIDGMWYKLVRDWVRGQERLLYVHLATVHTKIEFSRRADGDSSIKFHANLVSIAPPRNDRISLWTSGFPLLFRSVAVEGHGLPVEEIDSIAATQSTLTSLSIPVTQPGQLVAVLRGLPLLQELSVRLQYPLASVEAVLEGAFNKASSLRQLTIASYVIPSEFCCSLLSIAHLSELQFVSTGFRYNREQGVLCCEVRQQDLFDLLPKDSLASLIIKGWTSSILRVKAMLLVQNNLTALHMTDDNSNRDLVPQISESEVRSMVRLCQALVSFRIGMHSVLEIGKEEVVVAESLLDMVDIPPTTMTLSIHGYRWRERRMVRESDEGMLKRMQAVGEAVKDRLVSIQLYDCKMVTERDVVTLLRPCDRLSEVVAVNCVHLKDLFLRVVLIMGAQLRRFVYYLPVLLKVSTVEAMMVKCKNLRSVIVYADNAAQMAAIHERRVRPSRLRAVFKYGEDMELEVRGKKLRWQYGAVG